MYNLSFINAVNERAIGMIDRARTVQFSGHLYPSLKIWRHTSRLVKYARSWPCGHHIFPDFQLWHWSVASARASKRDVRFSAQRIQWNPLNGAAGACLYRQGNNLSLSTLLSWYPASSTECEQQPHNNIHHPVRSWSTKVYHVILGLVFS